MSELRFPSHYQCMGFEQKTVSSTAVGLTETEFGPKAPNVPKAHCAVVTLDGVVGTNDIRWTVDGTVPTSTIGHLLEAKNQLVIKGFGNIKTFRAIRTGAGDGVLTVSYF